MRVKAWGGPEGTDAAALENECRVHGENMPYKSLSSCAECECGSLSQCDALAASSDPSAVKCLVDEIRAAWAVAALWSVHGCWTLLAGTAQRWLQRLTPGAPTHPAHDTGSAQVD